MRWYSSPSPVMPNTKRSASTQSIHSFFSPSGPRCRAFSSSPDITLLGNLWSPMQSSVPDHNNLLVRICSLDTLTINSLESVFVGEGAVVRQLAPGSKGFEAIAGDVCSAELIVVALNTGLCRASVQESLYYLKFHHLGLRVQHNCLRAVVQLPRVIPEANPPRTYPLINLGRQVWCFSDGASQIDEGSCLTVVLLPRSVKDHLLCRRTQNRHAHDIRLALRVGQTKYAEEFNLDHHHPLQPAQRPRHNVRVVSAVSGPTLDGCS